jgi:hypothetical protein
MQRKSPFTIFFSVYSAVAARNFPYLSPRPWLVTAVAAMSPPHGIAQLRGLGGGQQSVMSHRIGF